MVPFSSTEMLSPSNTRLAQETLIIPTPPSTLFPLAPNRGSPPPGLCEMVRALCRAED
ncbi:hypothetical protein BJX65DRAFT_287533 [Aspergillus insuetus]